MTLPDFYITLYLAIGLVIALFSELELAVERKNGLVVLAKWLLHTVMWTCFWPLPIIRVWFLGVRVRLYLRRK